jgi:glucose-1-phosphate thymidylyltransferase
VTQPVGAVVIAAGLGTRLRPLTEQYAKPVLPLGGVPVVARLVRELAGAGLTEVTVVVGHLGDQVRRLLGDGSGFGLSLRYATQAEPLGSAHATAAADREPPYLVLGADTVFAPGDVGRFAAAFAAADVAGALAVQPDAGGTVACADGLVRHVVAQSGTHAAAALWAVGTALAERVAALSGEPPYELATAFQAGIDAGERVASIGIGPTRDLTSPVDLLLENFPYLRDL